MIKIQPAPILIESSETPTTEIIDLMIEKKTSYVLLTNSSNEISGIFTDRDVLRLFPTLTQDTNRKMAVLNYMNKPVITLPLAEIHLAPKTMVERNIRHVPILHNKNVVGIVTADSIFKSVIASLPRNILSISPLHQFNNPKNIGVLSPDGDAFSLFKNIFENEGQITLKRVWYNDLQSAGAAKALAKTCHLLVMDIDDIPIKNWLAILGEFNAIDKGPQIFLLLDPKKHPANIIEKVNNLKPIQWLHFFYKPLNITSLMSEANTILIPS